MNLSRGRGRRSALRSRRRARAVERRLHRRGGNPVRVDDERLHEQDDRDGADDRDGPVDRDAERVRQAAREPVDRVARLQVRRRFRRAPRSPAPAAVGTCRAAAAAAASAASSREPSSRLPRRRLRRRNAAGEPSPDRPVSAAGRPAAARPAGRRPAHAMPLVTALRACKDNTVSAAERRSRDAPLATLLRPPRVDAGVVSGEEHVGDVPAAERRRPRVVRVLDAARRARR